MSALGLGCVKTHTSKNVENKILQRGIRPYVHSIISFHDAHFLQNYPMRAADVGVFTRPRPKADIGPAANLFPAAFTAGLLILCSKKLQPGLAPRPPTDCRDMRC